MLKPRSATNIAGILLKRSIFEPCEGLHFDAYDTIKDRIIQCLKERDSDLYEDQDESSSNSGTTFPPTSEKVDVLETIQNERFVHPQPHKCSP